MYIISGYNKNDVRTYIIMSGNKVQDSTTKPDRATRFSTQEKAAEAIRFNRLEGFEILPVESWEF